MDNVAADASGVDWKFAGKTVDNMQVLDGHEEIVYWQNQTQSVPLVNATTMDARQVKMRSNILDQYGDTYTSNIKLFNITTGAYQFHSDVSGLHTPVSGEVKGIGVAAPNSNYDKLAYLEFANYSARWNQIESQNSDVQSQMDTFVEKTYSNYQNGQIENSDLVDPYVMQQEYSPDKDFQAWAVSSLTTMGVNSPDDMGSYGYVNLTYNGAEYQGVFMSQSNPAGGSFERGSAYDASAITGQQYIVTSGSYYELKGQFTITDIRSDQGEQVANITIQEKNYSTANTSEYKNVLNDLEEDRAEWEAWKKEQQSSSGGAPLFNGDSSTAILIITALGGGLLLLRESGDM